jgi:hypothetical protein
VEQQPWRSLLGWMRTAAKPFPRGSWIACSGRVLGVLDRELIHGPQLVDSTVRIWSSFPTTGNSFGRMPSLHTIPPRPCRRIPSTCRLRHHDQSARQASQAGTRSRPPAVVEVVTTEESFSPSRVPKHPDQNAAEPPASPKAPLNSTTAGLDPVLTTPASGTSSPFHANGWANCRFRYRSHGRWFTHRATVGPSTRFE